MIKPVLQDDEFLADVAEARQDLANLHLWWLGQSGFLVQWQGRHLLLDPYLSDSLTLKYARTDKPHVRVTERVVAPERLNFIDVATSSHNHTDHLDAETLKPLLKANPRMELVIPEANREFVVNRLGIVAELPCGLDAGSEVRLAGFKIKAVPAAHNLVERDPSGRHIYLGYVIEAGPWSIYHAGDTKLFPGMEAALVQRQVDLALLPINGDLPERRVAGNLDGREAATLAKRIEARLVIPCHYDMFEFNTASTDLFVSTARELGQPFRVLKCGERWSSGDLGI
jgi:L-ascorbate metabolism protein UlaG (beta-lactamase superfamily)